MQNQTPPSAPRILFLTAAVATAACFAVWMNRTALAQSTAQPPPATAGDTASAELAALKSEIELLKGKVPDQSHAMKDVGYHFTNLWFAGQKQNWPLAKFYCDETRAHLKWAVRIIPVRKTAGGTLDLKPILDGIDQSLFAAVQKAIDAKSATDFSEAYRQALGGCYSCHVAAEKPYLRLHVPEQPEARIIDFAPPE